MRRLARGAVQGRWSVRETERRARAPKETAAKPEAKGKSANVKDLERRLSHHLGTTVAVEKDSLVVRFADYEALDEILRRMGL
jgi:hypothetical protein